MSIQDLIDKFIREYKGDSIKEFDINFTSFCTQNNITKDQLNKWRSEFKMFLHENPTFVASWKDHYLLDTYKFN